MPILYHHAPVAHSAKLLIVLAEKGLAIETRRIEPPCGPDAANILDASHAGSVPVLVTDDGTAIGEFSVIAEYLDETFSDRPLMPAGLVDRWRARVWFKVANEDLAPATAILAWQAWALPRLEAARRAGIEVRLLRLPLDRQLFWREALEGFAPARLEHAREKITMVIGQLEERLTASAFLAGDVYSLADIDVWPFAVALPRLVPDLANPERTPRLADWITRVGARPVVASVMAGSRDEDWLPGPEPIRWG